MFHQKLKNLRKSNGMTQKALAQKLNISQQCVSNMESGFRQPSVAVLKKTALLFHVSTDYLLDINPDNTLDVSGFTTEQIILLKNLLNSIQKHHHHFE